MKALLFLLLAGSLAMGQDTLILKTGSQHLGRLIEIRETTVVFEIGGVGIGAEYTQQEVQLNLVDRIVLEDGTVAWNAPVSDSGQDTLLTTAGTNLPDKQNINLAPSLEHSMAKLAEAQARTATIVENYYKIYVASLIVYGVLVLFVVISR